MIIDVHTHLGRNSNMSARVDELLRSMDKAKIDKALVFAGSISGCPTDEMLKEIAPHHDRLYGVVAVELENIGTYVIDNPRRKKYYEEVLEDQLCQPNVVAAKFYLGYEHYYPTDEAVYTAMEVITRTERTAIFHTGDCYRAIKDAKLKYAHPLGIDDVATDYPDTRIVIAHMGYPWHRDAAEVCYKNSNVFADISGFVYGEFNEKSLAHFDQVVHEFVDVAGGTDRLLFGSDWPISDQTSYVRTEEIVFQQSLMKALSENVTRAFTL